jgi:hypothetical protein
MNFDSEKVISSQKYLNLLGLFEGPDESEERQKIYNQSVVKWPINEKITSCEQLQAMIDDIQNAINSALQSKVNDDRNANQRVQNRYIDAYTWRQNDVKAMYGKKQCAQTLEDQEQKEFFDNQYQNLERVKGLSDKAGNTTKYLVFGMLGVVVVISSIIIFKK